MLKKMLCLLFALGLGGVAIADDFIDDADDDNSLDMDGSAYANPGIYFGGLIGATNMHYSGSKYTTSASSYDDRYQFAARGYLGYAFSQFISLELGYDYFGRPKFKSNDQNTQDILQYGIDFMAKANLPLDYGFGLYAKGGLAWIFRSALHATSTGQFADKKSNGTITPIVALGINYWFAPNIALDLCWTKTMTVSDLPTIDFLAAGFIYKINI